jgi:hypothetical protein
MYSICVSIKVMMSFSLTFDNVKVGQKRVVEEEEAIHTDQKDVSIRYRASAVNYL